MNQSSSVREDPQSVSGVLTADNPATRSSLTDDPFPDFEGFDVRCIHIRQVDAFVVARDVVTIVQDIEIEKRHAVPSAVAD